MNKTYRILPSAEDMLLRLIRGLSLSDAERELLCASTLRHVEVSAETNEWELVVGTSAVLSEDLIARICAQIAENYDLAEVFLQQNVVALERAVTPVWERAVNQAAAGDAVLFHTLRQSRYAVDGNVLRLEAPGRFGAELLGTRTVTRRLEEAIRMNVGCACRVVCAECAIAEDAAQPAWTPPPMLAIAKKSPSAAQPASSRASRGAKKGAPRPENVIIGRAVQGEARELGVVEDEIKNIVLEGEIFAPPARTSSCSNLPTRRTGSPARNFSAFAGKLRRRRSTPRSSASSRQLARAAPFAFKGRSNTTNSSAIMSFSSTASRSGKCRSVRITPRKSVSNCTRTRR